MVIQAHISTMDSVRRDSCSHSELTVDSIPLLDIHQPQKGCNAATLDMCRYAGHTI